MSDIIKVIARELRKKQTPSEKVFWNLVRNRNLENNKFLRQYIIKFIFENKMRYFIADFYCAKKNLIIEIDGSIHQIKEDYDQLRTEIIKRLGINIIRISNEELNDINAVKDKILEYL